MGRDDFAQAQHALIDPLVEPDPSDETGLNSHFRSTFAPRQNITPPGSAGLKETSSVNIRSQHTGSSTDTNPFRRSNRFSNTPTLAGDGDKSSQRQSGYPSPPASASPRRDRFPNHRHEAFGSMNEGRPRRSSNPPPASLNPPAKDSGIARRSSLRERYPGDNSHRPLDTIRQDTKIAHRAHHLRKKNFQGTDTIDRLDNTTFGYHHEGPYDAANLARNTSWKHSPVAAVSDSNDEALRATPKENIIDAVTNHRPLEGVATIPPGVPDRFGRVLNYKEGADLHRERGGDLKRWPGVEYHKDDLKGKGEPSFSIDRALQNHKKYGDSGVEMATRSRNQSLGAADASGNAVLQSPFDDGAGIGRSNTTGKSVGNKLKSRFGSLRRRKADATEA